MKFQADFDSNIAQEAQKGADAVRALREEMALTNATMAKGKAGATIGEQVASARSPWAGPMRVNQQVADIYRATGALKKEQEAQAAKEKAADKAAAAERRRAMMDRARAGAGTFAGGAKMAVGAAAAAGGVAGALGLAQLAMGYQGMARLHQLMARTSLQARQMFLGVDSGPAVRAADRFLNSLFGKGQVGATALQGLLTRGFNGAFGAFERYQPIVTAFFQGIILGALRAENSYIRARIALLPLTDAIAEAIGPVGAINAAAGAGVVTFGALAVTIGGTVGGLLAVGAAIGTVIDQWRKLKKEWGEWKEGAALIGKQLRRDLGFTSAQDEANAADDKTRGGFSSDGERQAAVAARERWMKENGLARDAGEATGAAYAQGMANGAAAGAAAVNAAGQSLVDAMDKGVRQKGEIHSPSRLAARTAENFPAGSAEGIRRGAGRVQEAAEQAMVPSMGGVGASAAPAAPVRVEISQVNHFGGGSQGDIEAAMDAANARMIRALAVQLGIPVSLGAT